MTLTKAQQRRFDSVSDRVLAKAERTFGSSIQDAVLTSTRPSPFYGEACLRELEVATGELVFRVTVSVRRV
jgi:hypothetical protein